MNPDVSEGQLNELLMEQLFNLSENNKMKLNIMDTILIDSKIFAEDFNFQKYAFEKQVMSGAKLSENVEMKINFFY